jgi:hypothetical protein
MAESAWRNRIVRHDEVAPAELLANPFNARRHGQFQQEVVTDSLGELGWIQPIIVNVLTGHIVDGHLRMELSLRHGQTSVPITYVELSEIEEKKALLILDPSSGLAETDKHALEILLRAVQEDRDAVVTEEDSALQQLYAVMAKDAGIHSNTAPNVDFPEYDETAADDVEYITCPGCGHKWPK